MMQFCSSLFPEEGFASSWWPILSESLKYGSALWGFVDSKAPGGEQKIATLAASFLPPAFVLPPRTSHGVLYFSISSVSSSTQQIKHCFSPSCEQHTSSSVFRGHSWKPWRSWKSFSYSLSSNTCKVHQYWKCIIAVPALLGRSAWVFSRSVRRGIFTSWKKGLPHPLVLMVSSQDEAKNCTDTAGSNS